MQILYDTMKYVYKPLMGRNEHFNKDTYSYVAVSQNIATGCISVQIFKIRFFVSRLVPIMQCNFEHLYALQALYTYACD